MSSRFPRRAGTVTAALLASALALPAAGAPASAAPTPQTVLPTVTPVDGTATTDLDARLVALVNAARTARGLRPLRVVGGLWEQAQRRSFDNGDTRRLRHSPDIGALASAAGCRWTTVGEDVPFTPGRRVTADQVFGQYRGSPGHWAVLLNPRATHVGIATVDLPYGTTRASWNTVVVANGCRSTVPSDAVWGRYDERRVARPGRTLRVAGFETGRDPRAMAAATGPVSAHLLPATSGSGDDAARVRLAPGPTASGDGHGGLELRQGLGLARARALRVRLSATTSSGRPLPVTVLLQHGDRAPVRVGAVSVGSGPRTSWLRLPAAARGYSDRLYVVVDGAALRATAPGDPAPRAVLAVYDVVAVG
ncbi:MAG: CAP domain-containing protein [Candidatus Nanopelagicales bacterium]